MTSAMNSVERTPTPAQRVLTAKRYAVPRHPAPIDLFLASNEGRRPQPELSLDRLDAPNLYPNVSALEEKLAQRVGVEADRVLVTCGADDALFRVALAMLEPGREALVATPTFEMIPRYVELAGGSLVDVAWPEDGFPTDALLTAATDRTALVFVVSPNNPTGQVATLADVERLAKALPQAWIVLDHAYCEFGDEDLTLAALEFPNVIVLRTFSKAWGLAGMRVGYAMGQPEMLAVLARAGNPYPVSRASVQLALARLENEEDMREQVQRVRVEREQLQRELEALGARCIASQANFVLARVPNPVWLRDALAGLGIAIRVFPGSETLADAVRIGCPASEASFERLLSALRAALAPRAILFDMDGVLADVSRSYRVAILETAASFGVDATAEDVSRVKALGDANDDWDLTRRLLAEKGRELSFEVVQERFEELYQGTAERPGLRETETLMFSREELERLRKQGPLGIVTGRPRSDAQRFLEERGVADLFDTVVCREDAPLKPDPAPVRFALDALGVRNAWMIGDTVDDVRAARAAGVVPLGYLAPGEGNEDSLLRAGAARVLTGPKDLEDLLS